MSDKDEDVVELYDDWLIFSTSFNKRFQKMAKEGMTNYGEFMKIWSESSKAMTEEMKRGIADEEKANDLINVWKGYIDNMNKQMSSGFGEDSAQNDLTEQWSEYSTNITNNLMGIMDTRLREQKELYDLWMDDFSTWQVKREGEEREASTFPFHELLDPWMKAFRPEIKEGQGFVFPLPDPRDIWEPFIKEGGGFPDPDELFNNFQRMQDEWSKNYSSAVKEFMRTPTFATWSGDMVNRLVEGKEQMNDFTSKYLRFVGLPTQSDLESIRLRLSEMDKKLDEFRRENL